MVRCITGRVQGVKILGFKGARRVFVSEVANFRVLAAEFLSAPRAPTFFEKVDVEASFAFAREHVPLIVVQLFVDAVPFFKDLCFGGYVPIDVAPGGSSR